MGNPIEINRRNWDERATIHHVWPASTSLLQLKADIPTEALFGRCRRKKSSVGGLAGDSFAQENAGWFGRWGGAIQTKGAYLRVSA
jgi:hypothetical protein